MTKQTHIFDEMPDYDRQDGRTRDYREFEFALAIRSRAARLANRERR